MKFYIALNFASPQHWYWSQPAQNWTTIAADATLFDSREDAEAEAPYAQRATTRGEVDVREHQPISPQAIKPKTGPLEVGEVLRVGILRWGQSNPNQPQEPTALLLVTRLTATQAIAEHFGPGPRYSPTPVRMRRDGRLIGSEGMYVWAYRATQENIDKVIADAALAARYRSARLRVDDLIGKELHQLKLTTEQLEHLAAAWEQVKAMAPATGQAA